MMGFASETSTFSRNVTPEPQAEASDAVDWLQKALADERKAFAQLLAREHQDLLRRFQQLPPSAFTGAAPSSRRPNIQDPGAALPSELPSWLSKKETVEPPPAKDLSLLPGVPRRDDLRLSARESEAEGAAESNEKACELAVTKLRSVQDKLEESIEAISEEADMSNFRNIARDFLEFKLDIISGVVILLYIVGIAVKTEYKGVELAYSLSAIEQFQDSRPPQEAWPYAKEVFIVLEWCFVTFFCAELAARIIFNISLWQDLFWNMFDTVIIIMFFVEQSVSLEDLIDFNPTVMRMMRLVKLLRLLKLVRFVRSFDALHLIIKSIASTLGVLGHSVALILTLMVFVAVIMANLLGGFIEDAAEEDVIRVEAFMRFGTFWRALLSIFEITLANWGPHCWFLVNNVSQLWGGFFIVWRSIVGFAVIQVISSVFIQHTFKIASRDEDIMIQEKVKASECYLKHLDSLFMELDEDGSGAFTLEELELALENPRVRGWFGALEIEVSDASALFRMLDDGDGEIDKEEFLTGLRQMKGAAKRLDIMQVMKDCQAIRRGLVTDGRQRSGPRHSVAHTPSSRMERRTTMH